MYMHLMKGMQWWSTDEKLVVM